ncbi:hypothetical protein RKE25_00675 [Dyella sp. BiH032]|uniref:hypothetical protein n=1 Tax=Dyella sp. BiH032 TaxID=3075430 RepID=UPI002892BCA6|nr:hypothetical protein [Dyella sp. BiH032]WNL46179.1 hypothetical protein RKE25_00675 [Dyella sp. BiH032]
MACRQRRVSRHGWIAVALLLLSTGLAAQQNISPELEYKKLLKIDEDIQPLGENPFGENIGLYNGSLSFSQTDISLSGTGPLLQLTRSFRITGKDDTDGFANWAFADWELDLPRITTIAATQQNVQDWMVDGPSPLAICTHIGIPPVVMKPGGITSRQNWGADEWWHGYQLVMPGGDSQDILGRSQGNYAYAPQMPGQVFPALTKKHWMIGCLPQAANDSTREAFFALAPDGTKYTFDYFGYSQAPIITKPIPLSDGETDDLYREYAALLVTKIEDRFGNWLHYNYTGGNLTSITASDGREISLQYNSNGTIASVTAQPSSGTPRTWTYSYGTFPATGQPTLTRVTQPDQSEWGFAMANLKYQPDLTPNILGDCNSPGVVAPSSWSGSITHPSGLTGTFTVTAIKHGRSHAPKSCWGGDYETGYALVPRAWYSYTITNKIFSGAGLPASQSWNYSYSPANDSWDNDCVNGCPSTVWTDVVNPDGRATRYTFSNWFDISEGRMLRTDMYVGNTSSAIARSEITQYASESNGPWPSWFGTSWQGQRINEAITSQVAPLQQKDIQQDGDTYTWLAESFNEFAQVTKTKRYNSFSQDPVEEQTAYLNDLPHWVLGLPTQVDNIYKGQTETIDKYVYDLSNVTLSQRYRFGQPVMSYTFNAQGQLASFTDGNTHTTTLGNYKRGIPQLIGYPDSTTQSLVVDDFGQITSITDQAGATTSYTYDPVGRIKRIYYPLGDEVAWYPKTFDYAFVGAAEQGVPANHWRRVTTKGNAVTTTYFDAMLRPVLSTTSISGTSTAISARTDYDWKGQKTFVSYPVNGAPDRSAITAGTTSFYDTLGRLTQTQQTSELGTLTATTTYLSGARRQVTDPKNYVTTTSYQVFDQPTYDAVIQVQAPEGINQTIIRDQYGNPTQIHQWGTANGLSGDVTKTLVYDSYHRLCRTSEPESGSEVTAYDNANNVAWTASGMAITGTDCGYGQVPTAAQTTRSYDPMNRVLTLAPPAGTQSTTYSYDPLGNVHTASSGVTFWTGFRNKLGQLTGESLQVDGQDLWRMGYAHDAYGSVSTIQYPDGEAVSYAPDALGRATQVGGYATGVSYYPDGEVASFTFGNGDSYAVQKNARQLLSNFTYGNGGALKLSEDYAYDANGNITSITDLAAGTRTKTFGYDTLNRLTNAQASNLWGTESYGYDPINNIRSRVSGGQMFTYNYDATNRLTSITQGANAVVTLGYDNRGNVNSRNGTTMNFDQKNQLTDIPGYDSYQYDAAGRRVIKTPANGAGATYYFYTQAGQLVYAFDASASKATNYIYLGKKLIARNESLKLGNPASITFSANASGGNYTVNWTAVPGATSYNLQISADNGASWNVAGSGTLTGTSLAVLNQEGGDYLYRVQACAASGCVSGWTVSATLGVTPATPTIMVPGGIVNGNYTVSWTAPMSATSYDVQEALNGGAWVTIAADTTALSISRPGTASGNYTYQVQAKNSHGTRGFVTSSVVKVDTTYGVVPPAPTSLAVPAASADGNAALSWASVSQITHYVVQQSSDGGSNWSNVYDGTATTAALSGLANGSYLYRVEACNAYNCSAWKAGSNALVVTHPPTGIPTLSVPSNSTSGSYAVSWTAVSTATSYTLQESTNGGGTWSTAQSNGGTSWSTSGRGNGSYSYRVQACNVGGCGGWSSTGTTTVLLPPPMPASISVPATSNGPVAISWAASSTATSYNLAQSFNGGGLTGVYSGAATSVSTTESATGSVVFYVQACNASGCSGYKTSSAVTVTIPPSSAPGISAPSSNNSGSYTVSWSGVGGATYYNLQEQLNGGGWTLVQANGSTSWGASGKGTATYGYRVQACNAGGCGPWSGTANVVVTRIPATPTAPDYSLSGGGAKHYVYLNWSTVAGATSYDLEETNSNDGTFIVYTGPNTTFSELTDITGDTIQYRVRACNSAGCSPWSGYRTVSL